MKHLFNSILIACTISFLFSCTKAQNSGSVNRTMNTASIINGVDVPSDNELGQSTVGLMLEYKGTWYQACSGSIIAKNMILTSAHCVSYANSKRDNIVISFSLNTFDNDLQENPSTAIKDVRNTFNTIDVVDIISHPQYVGDVDYDLAIIRLKNDIPLTHKSVEFLPQSFIDLSGTKLTLDGQTHDVTLLGFGVTGENPYTNTTTLKMTTIPAKFENAVLVTDQTHGSGACHGDSGGPAFVKLNAKNYLVGVTHGPYKDYVTCHEFGAYFNPNFTMAFIEQTIKDLNLK